MRGLKLSQYEASQTNAKSIKDRSFLSYSYQCQDLKNIALHENKVKNTTIFVRAVEFVNHV